MAAAFFSTVSFSGKAEEKRWRFGFAAGNLAVDGEKVFESIAIFRNGFV